MLSTTAIAAALQPARLGTTLKVQQCFTSSAGGEYRFTHAFLPPRQAGRSFFRLEKLFFSTARRTQHL
jgi:hypothetical protein